MTPDEIAEAWRMTRIFAPRIEKKRSILEKQGKRMVHYTSAENLLKIISTKTMWLRNTRCMADFREVEHGHDLLVNFFHHEHHRNAFFAAVDACHAGLGQESLGHFDSWWANILMNTYICSVSEHEDDEDQHGRLSMWRAFGQQTKPRAAMVMKPPKIGDAEDLQVLLSPVEYFGDSELEIMLLGIIENIKNETVFLKTIDRDRMKALIFFMLSAISVSLKHVGFKEEKEWRVIYFPQMNKSNLIRQSIETIDGIPQIIHKIPLAEDPEHGVVGVGLPSLLDRVIIGPTNYPLPIYSALTEALRQAGVPEPENKVVFSGIPIRS